MSIDYFLEDCFDQLIAEALKILPRGSKFLRYQSGTFTFIQRRDSGTTALHEAKAKPLDLIRHRFNHDHFTRFEIVSPTYCKDPTDLKPTQRMWRSSYGIYGAPEGTYVCLVTHGDPHARSRDFGDGRTLTSYGIISDGSYKRLHGTNWHGKRGHYTEWVDDAVVVTIQNGYVRINPDSKGDPTNSRYDFYVNPDNYGPDADLEAFAMKLNEHLCKECSYQFSWGKPRPSPYYFDTSKWEYIEDPEGNPRKSYWKFTP